MIHTSHHRHPRPHHKVESIGPLSPAYPVGLAMFVVMPPNRLVAAVLPKTKRAAMRYRDEAVLHALR